MRVLVFSLLILLTIFHQDFWWRTDDKTLVLGFLPVSLAYHIGVSVVASLLWGMACFYCWPKDAEVSDEQAAAPMRGGH